MLIDACARLAAYSGDPQLRAIKDRLVNTVIENQLPNGYSGFYREDRRLWNPPGSRGDNWDIHEMAFLIEGLLTDYELFGDRRSLEAARKTADLILAHYDEMPPHYTNRVDLHVLNTGLDGAILKLYRHTGDGRYLDFSTRRKSLYAWNTPIVIGRRLGVSGHMFAYLAMCLAQQDLYRLTGDDVLLNQTRRAMGFLLAEDGLTITGSAGQREIWTNDQDGEGELGETCATAYQLRVYESLLRLTGESLYGDLIERTVFNGLFGAQSPDGKRLRYFTPFEGPRQYYPHQHMCCPGNFRRIISELPGMVCYTTADSGVAVNLYTASEATIPLEDGREVRIRQVTDYPTSGRIEIHVKVSRPGAFPLWLRIPRWAKGATVRLPGWSLDLAPGRFARLEHHWSGEETLVLDLPMQPRFVLGRQRQAGRVALMRGPLIYGFNPDANPEATVNGRRTLHELGRLLLDPRTLGDVLPDDSVRPGGTAFRIKAWRESRSGLTDTPHEFTLKLTEFPDPGCQLIYFKIPDYSVAVDDELIAEPPMPGSGS
ncbi:MAG: hypothetical protein D6766_11915 [Verrucomicrobia bacterium]|nr:MAG: hypothetical protein D6766_11915 [Verrucomicrobiota bacterium]